MKRKSLKTIVSFILLMIAACDEPETVVTNIVHPDGSVTRRIEMRNMENKFEISKIQVPFDSTWIVRDSLEINGEGDTLWIKRAEKNFKNVSEINRDYLNDSSANKSIMRKAEFSRKFRWFNTEYRFAEVIDKKLSFGYPVADFMSPEELKFFYSPEDVNYKKEHGPDSLKYRALKDSVKIKQEKWTFKCLVSEWLGDFEILAKEKTDNDSLFISLKNREDELVRLFEQDDKKFDSLWTNGILLKEILGEPDFLKFKPEADSAMNLVVENLFVDFKSYTIKIIMPGEIVGTNGMIDSSKTLVWPVMSDYFLAEPYSMFAESRIPNKWAWIASGAFLIFVLSGIIFRVIKKG